MVVQQQQRVCGTFEELMRPITAELGFTCFALIGPLGIAPPLLSTLLIAVCSPRPFRGKKVFVNTDQNGICTHYTDNKQTIQEKLLMFVTLLDPGLGGDSTTILEFSIFC